RLKKLKKLKKLKRVHRAVSRKPKGSQNRKKAARRRGGQDRKGATARATTVPQFTSRLAKTKAVVVSDDLPVAGMLKNHRLAPGMAEVGWGELRGQLDYKAVWYGGRVVVADRWEKSSKTGSCCGWVDEDLTRADRTFP